MKIGSTGGRVAEWGLQRLIIPKYHSILCKLGLYCTKDSSSASFLCTFLIITSEDFFFFSYPDMEEPHGQ